MLDLAALGVMAQEIGGVHDDLAKDAGLGYPVKAADVLRLASVLAELIQHLIEAEPAA